MPHGLIALDFLTTDMHLSRPQIMMTFEVCNVVLWLTYKCWIFTNMWSHLNITRPCILSRTQTRSLHKSSTENAPFLSLWDSSPSYIKLPKYIHPQRSTSFVHLRCQAQDWVSGPESIVQLDTTEPTICKVEDETEGRPSLRHLSDWSWSFGLSHTNSWDVRLEAATYDVLFATVCRDIGMGSQSLRHRAIWMSVSQAQHRNFVLGL